MRNTIPSGGELEKILADMRQAKRTPLTEQEKAIIRLRFALDSEKPKTPTETAKILKIRQSLVRHLERKALNKLRVGYHVQAIEEILEMIAGV